MFPSAIHLQTFKDTGNNDGWKEAKGMARERDERWWFGSMNMMAGKGKKSIATITITTVARQSVT